MVGLANAHSTITPCNSGLQRLADSAEKESPQVVETVNHLVLTVSDGMGMGTEGMKYSLFLGSDRRLYRDLRKCTMA